MRAGRLFFNAEARNGRGAQSLEIKKKTLFSAKLCLSAPLRSKENVRFFVHDFTSRRSKITQPTTKPVTPNPMSHIQDSSTRGQGMSW